MKTYLTKTDDGYEVLGEARCTRLECESYGCEFPNCARRTGETFSSEEDARIKYPDLEIV